jgi:hypothetical protein
MHLLLSKWKVAQDLQLVLGVLWKTLVAAPEPCCFVVKP